MDASGKKEGLSLALRSTAHEGICTSTGIYWQPTEIPLLEMYATGITFKTGLAHARTLMPDVLALVESGRLRPQKVTGRTLDWNDAVDALTDLNDKIVITRPATS